MNGAPTFGSLFAGIGGFDLGLERAGWACNWQVEIDPFCRRILERHWPAEGEDGREVVCARHDDVRTFPPCVAPKGGLCRHVECWNPWWVDLICGGFPCQPVSVAGKRRAQADERWLWPEFARVVRTLRPRFVLVENVPGLLDGGLGDILRDLAACGFHAEWDVLGASAVGAPHERERVWMVAYANSLYGDTRLGVFDDDEASLRAQEDRDRTSVWLAPPCVPARVGHGAACWMDRRERTEVIGNAIVPQIAEWIGRRLMEAL